MLLDTARRPCYDVGTEGCITEGCIKEVAMGWRAWLKGAVFWLVFLAGYGAYRFFPLFPLSLVCGTTESNFQHYKAGFFAWLFASAMEYAFARPPAAGRARFVYSRMTAAIFLPWFIFLLWYIAPAVYGPWPHVALEITWANLVTAAVGLCTAVFERGLAQITFGRGLRTVLLVLFVVSIGLYVIFTFRLPWADVFVEPQWR